MKNKKIVMKKFLCLFFVFSSSLNICFSQSGNQFHELIIESMKCHIDIINCYQNRGILSPSDKIIFLRDNFPDDFPFEETEKELGIVFFEKSLFSKSELRRGIGVNKLAPIELNNDTISIGFIDYSLQIRNKQINLANGGVTTCKFVLNSQTKQWEKKECKDWGI